MVDNKENLEVGNSRPSKIIKISKVQYGPAFWIIMSLLVTILVSVFVEIYSFVNYGTYKDISTVVKFVNDESVKDIVEMDDKVILTLKERSDEFPFGKVYTNLSVNRNDDFVSFLQKSGVDNSKIVNYRYEKTILISPFDVIMFFVFLGVLYLLYNIVKNMSSSGSRLMEFGQSRAKLFMGKKDGITFDDVAGIDDAKEELTEIVEFLKNPKKYTEIGARIPRGLLLVGDPGTGKTLLARAVAGTAGVPFFLVSGSEFDEMLVGSGSSRVRDLFNKAKTLAPCIIFIDEIDSVARKRTLSINSSNADQTLNQLLVEMDGLEPRDNVIVIAATNRPDVLDEAILRRGRFDRIVNVSLPDKDGREAILAVHAKNKKIAEDVDFSSIATKTTGFSGADLENLLNEAAIIAVNTGKTIIDKESLAEAYLKVRMGRKKNRKYTDSDIKRTAYHEAGHAIVGKYTDRNSIVDKISILSRGESLGVTVYSPKDDSLFVTKSQLVANIESAVAGKIAEDIIFGDISTGASSDIKQATRIARNMIKIYGMNDVLGFVYYGEDEGYMGYNNPHYSPVYAEMIDNEVKRIISDAENKARKILNEKRELLDKLVELLISKEVISAEEFDDLCKSLYPE